jgi:LysM repeat protein
MSIMSKKWLLVIGLALLLQAALVPISAAAPPVSDGFWHTVWYGETLSSIGWRYGVNPYSICSANGLVNCNYIYVGQSLYIPSYYWDGGGSSTGRYYTVRYGDTLSSIGLWYGVSPWSIAHANGIYNLNMVYAGQTLYIPY